MVGTTFKQELLNFIGSMHEQGILDYHFDNIRSLQTIDYPRIVSRMISNYTTHADDAMEAITRLLNDEAVDFNHLTIYVQRLKESSTSIGGCRMAGVCRELQQASDEMNKDRCLAIFERVKTEYQTLHNNLAHIQQLESSILTYESRRRRD